MTEDNFEKINRLAKGLRLSAQEKMALWADIEAHTHKPLPTLSPYPLSWAAALRYSLALFLVAAITTVSASEAALPGDWLYPIKVEVNEKVAVSLATSDEAKANVQVSLAKRRLQEAEAIATSKTEAPASKKAALDELNQRLGQHVNEAQAKVKQIKSTKPTEAAKVASDLEISLGAHQEVLSTLAAEEPENSGALMALSKEVQEQASTTDALHDEISTELLAQASSTVVTLIEEQIESAKATIAEAENSLAEANDDANQPTIEKQKEKMAEANKLLDEVEKEIAAENFDEAMDIAKKSAKLAASIEPIVSLSRKPDNPPPSEDPLSPTDLPATTTPATDNQNASSTSSSTSPLPPPTQATPASTSTVTQGLNSSSSTNTASTTSSSTLKWLRLIR